MGAVHAKSFQKDETFNAMPQFENSFSNDASEHDSIFSNVDKDEIKNEMKLQHDDTKYENVAVAQNIKAKVDIVHFDGLKRTRDDIAIKLTKELFSAQNLQQVIQSSLNVRQKLDALGAFESIEIVLDTSKGPKATNDGIDVNINVVEKNKIKAGLSTMVDNNEGSFVFNAKMPNIFGRGEQFHCEYQRGRKSSGFNFGFNKPIINLGNLRINSSLFQQGSEYPWSGYKSQERGIATEMAFSSSPSISHVLRWEGIWRELNCLDPYISFKIREDIGHSCKSALKHILKIDTRNGLIFPSVGHCIKLQQELAGLGGNVNMIKHELEYQTNYTIFPNIILQGSFAAGILKGWGNGYYNVCDKFYLGGPLSLRGFDMCGVGPRDEESALGADSYWAAAMHLYTPLPYLSPDRGLGSVLRTHFFVNTGNIGNFTFSEDYHNYLKSILNKPRWSYGVGLVLSLNTVARLELNYAIPVKAQPTDKVKPGLQFGIGLSFL